MAPRGKALTTSNGGLPGYDERMRYNDTVEAIRRIEYPMLNGLTYLDHAGTALPSKSLIDTFSQQMQTHLIGNPHSASALTPSVAQVVTQSTRLKVLQLFNADPDHFEVVFVANATAAIKLVAEALNGYDEGFDYYYHRDCHTSLIGVRELAKKHHCFAGAHADQNSEQWLRQGTPDVGKEKGERTTLFAYPAQSNMNGRRLPLTWPRMLRDSKMHPNTFVLLDVAAIVTTGAVDLSDHTAAPDFLSLSFYKIYGSPDLGALIIRKSAAHVFNQRRYFGGGTVGMITCGKEPWVVKKPDLCAALEDGTGPTHSILALKCAIDVHEEMFGGMSDVSKHTTWLAEQLYNRLTPLRHGNGQAVCEIYKDRASTYGDPDTQGATVAFNVRNSKGEHIPTQQFGNEAMARNIHVRSGALCNPAGIAHVLNIADTELRNLQAAGYSCGDEIPGRRTGIVRASLGACSTLRDVEVLVQFIQDHVVERQLERPNPTLARKTRVGRLEAIQLEDHDLHRNPSRHVTEIASLHKVPKESFCTKFKRFITSKLTRRCLHDPDLP